jgi:iron complex transport system ATP-binding protein
VHDLNLASQYCQRILLLNQGKLIADGNPIDVLTESQLSSVFKLPCQVEQRTTEQDPSSQKPRIFFSLPQDPSVKINAGAQDE